MLDLGQCFQSGINYAGNDIRSMEPSTPELCKIACFYEHGCNFWTYRIDKKRCYLKTTYQQSNNQMSSNYISGPKICGADDTGKMRSILHTVSNGG